MHSLKQLVALEASPAGPGAVPDRYAIEQEADGKYLCCREAPEVKVRIDRALAFSAAAARKAPEGSIFLDGAAQGEPFIDTARRVFNLDHHAGCVRAFTLATCEQALVLVLRGLDLRERTWTIYANDPDLDTVLAIWVLLNAMHLAGEDARVRQAAIPLLRLEGIIDSHGPDLVDLAGLPPPLLEETQRRLADLRRAELAVKESGAWEGSDRLEFTADQLRRLDSILYPAEHFAGFPAIEILARAELNENRTAVVCRSASGVFEAEGDLKRLYGKRLGVVALQKDARTYSLRQVDPFLPGTLEAVYALLNILDPAVRSSNGTNRWDGSAEIGGSPRISGTRLSPQEIAEACRQSFRRPSWVERALAVTLAAGVSAVSLVGAAAARLGAHDLQALVPGLGRAAVLAADPLSFAVCTSLLAWLLLIPVGRGKPRLFGARFPSGWDWLRVTPLAILGALAGGAWVILPNALAAPQVITLLALPFAAELFFRSLVHGILGRSFAVQHDGGRWFLSWPTLCSAVLYALASRYCSLPASSMIASQSATLVPLVGGLAFGLAAGTARERSGSVLAPLILHWFAALVVVAVALSLR